MTAVVTAPETAIVGATEGAVAVKAAAEVAVENAAGMAPRCDALPASGISASMMAPPGFTIVSKERKGGISAGHKDKYYRAPDGTLLRSLQEVYRFLKRQLHDLDNGAA